MPTRFFLTRKCKEVVPSASDGGDDFSIYGIFSISRRGNVSSCQLDFTTHAVLFQDGENHEPLLAHDVRIKAYEASSATGRSPVIPCRHDLVQMPSEGMAAIYSAIDKDTSYPRCYPAFIQEMDVSHSLFTKYAKIQFIPAT